MDMAARGKTRDDPIVLRDEPAFFDLTLSDDDDGDQDKVNGYGDIVELSESPAAWHRAQNRRSSIRASTSVRDNSTRSNSSDTSPPKQAALQPLVTQETLLDATARATATAGKQEQTDQKISPLDIPPVHDECAPAKTTDLLRTTSPTAIESAQQCETSQADVQSTNELLIVSLTSRNKYNSAPETVPAFIQAAAVLASNLEHERRPGSSTSEQVEREQTLSELTTTNTGLTMSDPVNGLGAPSKDHGSLQPLVPKKNEKAIKSAKPSGRLKIQTRPREKASQKILNTSGIAHIVSTARPTDTQPFRGESEALSAAARESLVDDNQQEAAGAQRVNDTAPPAISPTAQPSPDVESVNTNQQPLQDQHRNVDRSANSVPLTMAIENCADLEGGDDVAALVDPTQDNMEDALHMVQRCLHRHLDDRHGTHAYLTRAALRRHRTCQERDFRAQSRLQQLSAQCAPPKKYMQTVSPFEGMASIQLPLEKKSRSMSKRVQQETFSRPGSKIAVAKSSWSVQPTTHTSNAVVVPQFKEYVTLKRSILSDNESKLLLTPFVDNLQDSRDRELRKQLPQNYIISHDENVNLDLRSEQSRFYKDAIDIFLKELNISWNDILFWFLSSTEDIDRLNKTVPGSRSYESVIIDRSALQKETFMRDGKEEIAELFDRTDRKWQELLLCLQEPTVNKLRLSALACTAILEACGFNVWYLVKQCDIVRLHILRNIKAPTDAQEPTYRAAMCRVCYEHSCLLHGEIREHPADESSSEEPDQSQSTAQSDDEREGLTSTQLTDIKRPAHVGDDSDVENAINYRIPVNADTTNEPLEPVRFRKPPEVFNARWWKNNADTGWDCRKPFFPCNHEGRCDEAKCRCYRENIPCEKTCKCLLSCNRRFPGCSSTCAPAPNKRICASEKCLCILFDRECDADLCGACGATEVLDPVNRYNEAVLQSHCPNVSIQRGVPSKTLLGHSEVHGFGLYCGEAMKKGDFICEYTGETLSVDESDRRHTIYEYQQTMYAFKLNKRQEVDATYMGNKSRFINNADTNLVNCHVKNLMCNTVLRIGLYASVDMEPGTELFFHYNYTEEQTKDFKQPKSQVIAIKQTNKPVKNRAKQNLRLLISDDEVSDSISGSSSRRSTQAKALAKARVAKAAKSATRTSTVSTLQDTDSLEGGEGEFQNFRLAMEIKDTDDEVEFQPDVGDMGSGSEAAAEDSDEGGLMPYPRGKLRKQPDSVVAVKQRGGLRTGASRKRKR